MSDQRYPLQWPAAKPRSPRNQRTLVVPSWRGAASRLFTKGFYLDLEVIPSFYAFEDSGEPFYGRIHVVKRNRRSLTYRRVVSEDIYPVHLFRLNTKIVGGEKRRCSLFASDDDLHCFLADLERLNSSQLIDPDSASSRSFVKCAPSFLCGPETTEDGLIKWRKRGRRIKQNALDHRIHTLLAGDSISLFLPTRSEKGNQNGSKCGHCCNQSSDGVYRIPIHRGSIAHGGQSRYIHTNLLASRWILAS